MPMMLRFVISVHPRVCGEQVDPRDKAATDNGSSPRVRGTVAQALRLRTCTRFIPACAGNSRPGTTVEDQFAVHPRVCGEQPADAVAKFVSPGSSPRVRGTGRVYRRRIHHGRFIPACAGNSLLPGCDQYRRAVHPRVCGEQSSHISTFILVVGSSPRVRGTDRRHGGGVLSQRFIPACAGNRL